LSRIDFPVFAAVEVSGCPGIGQPEPGIVFHHDSDHHLQVENVFEFFPFRENATPHFLPPVVMENFVGKFFFLTDAPSK
jgi:hypothetical protein